MHEELLVLAAVIVIVIIIVSRRARAGAEYFSEVTPALPNASFVRLYEGFNYTHEVFNKNADSAKDQSLYYRILMPIYLKSIDINVTPGDRDAKGNPRGVSIYSVYPGDVVASSVATGIYMDAYDDPAFAFRANSPKYQHVVSVKPGEHLRMELEDTVKRIFMVINV
jgi:hypothetical protein